MTTVDDELPEPFGHQGPLVLLENIVSINKQANIFKKLFIIEMSALTVDNLDSFVIEFF